MTFKDWLEQTDMSRGEVADKLGVTVPTVSKLATGTQAWVSRDLASKLLKLTHGQVSPVDFLEDWTEC